MLRPYYWKNTNILMWFSYGFDDDKKEFMIPAQFRQEWVEIVTVDTYGMGNPDNIFAMLNQDDSPLATKEGQEFIKTVGVKHTSMSVGDLLHDTKKDIWLVCLNGGWGRIKWIEEK